jgi:cytochrome c
MMMKAAAASVVLAVMAASPVLAAECTLGADADAGKVVAKKCMACHTFVAAKPSMPTAPNLHDVYGGPPASRKDFPRYSEGMKGAADKGMLWTDDNLFEYINDPKAFLDKVNGHEVKHMMFFQLKDEAQRKSVIAYLKAIKGKPDCD